MRENNKPIQLFAACQVLLFIIVLGLAMYVSANQLPVASANPSEQTVYVGEEAWFSGNDSYDPDGGIDSYFWDFQDGASSSQPYTSHVYSVPGNYTVTLTVTDNLGGTATDSVIVTVLESSAGGTAAWIEALFTEKEEYSIEEIVNATAVVSREYGNGPPVWEGTLTLEVFNETDFLVHYDERQVFLTDVASMGNSYFSFNLTAAGRYLVRASLYDSVNEFIDDMELNLTVAMQPQNLLPVAVAESDLEIANVGEPVRFYAHRSHDPDGLLVHYRWDLGDGTSEDEINISHVYDTPGSYSAILTVRDDGGAESHDIVSVEIVIPNAMPPDGDDRRPVLLGTEPLYILPAAGILAVFALFFGTEAGRYRFYRFFPPLYTKLKKDELLEHFTRGKIYGYIMANPGDHFNSIKKALKLSDGTFYHHIHILEREGMIKSARDGTYRRFYPSGMRIPSSEGSLKSSQLLIIEKIQENPGISQKGVAALLGVSSPTINYHMKELVRLGIIRAERAGMSLRYYVVAENGMIQKGSHESVENKEVIDYS